MIKLLDILQEAKESFEDFAITRGKGAAKIAENAEEKGGLSLLTWHHFKVKAPYYKKAAEGKFDKEDAKKKRQDDYKNYIDSINKQFKALKTHDTFCYK